MAAASPSTSSTPSPGKTSSISAFSREKLERHFTDAVRKLRAKEKELSSVSAERDALTQQLSSAQDSALQSEELRARLEKSETESASIQRRLEECQAKLQGEEQKHADAQDELSFENDALSEQVQALKDQLRAAAAARDADIEAAVAPLKSELESKVQTTSRMESIVRSARNAAGKADAQAQVLEGALSATKARMEEMEGAKANLESQVTRLTTDLDDALSSQSRRSELEAKIAGLQQQLSALQPGPGSPHENDRRSNPDQGNEATASEPSPHHEEASKAREEALLDEIEQLKLASQSREQELGEKIRGTQAELDLLLPQLEASNQTLAESAAEGSRRAEELGSLLAEREAQVAELEGRIARSEAALNTATADLEEKSGEIEALGEELDSSKAADSAPDLGENKQPVGEPPEHGEQNLAAAIQPQVPEISEGSADRSRKVLEDLKERIEELEEHARRLEAENVELRQTAAESLARAENQKPCSSEGEKAGHESKSQEEPSAQENRSEAASVEAQEANQAEKLAEASTAAQRVEMLEQQLKGVQTQLEESQSRAALFSTNGDPEEGVKPSGSDQAQLQAEKEQLSEELAECKRRFTSTAKRKQAEYAKRVKELEDLAKTSKDQAAQLESELVAVKASLDALSAASKNSESAEVAAALEEGQRARDEIANLAEQLQASQAELTTAVDARIAAEEKANQADEKAAETSKTVDAVQADVLRLRARLADAEERAVAAERKLEESSVLAAQSAPEAAQLAEQLEAAKSGLAKEKERAARFIMDLKKRLEKSSKETKKAEEEAKQATAQAADLRQQAEATQSAQAKDKEAAAQQLQRAEEAARKSESELASYKNRAHNLLKNKEAELRAVRESAEHLSAAELSTAKSEVQKLQVELAQVKAELATEQRNASEALQDAESRHEQVVAELREAADEAGLAADSTTQAVEQWRRRYEALEGRMEALRAEKQQLREPPPALVQKHADQVAALEHRLAVLQEELMTFRETAEKVAEAKDGELERVLSINASLRDEITVLQSHQGVVADGNTEEILNNQLPPSPWSHLRKQSQQPALDDTRSFYSAGSLGPSGSFANNLGLLTRREEQPSRSLQDDGWTYSEGRAGSDWGFGLEPQGLQESSLLRLAEQQARRDEELNAVRQRAEALESELSELSREVELRQEQEAALKEALREVEREKARSSLADKQKLDIEYLKNTILKLYETGEAPTLLPAFAMLLHLSPAEVKRCQEALARQAENPDEASAPKSAAAGDPESAGYLSSWTNWAFGEGEAPIRDSG